MKVTVKDFGKDHWSLLAYIETRVIDFNVAPNVGELDREHLSCNEKKHPMLIGYRTSGLGWNPKYGTKLKGYWNKDTTVNPNRQLGDHDDWDSLQELEDAGMIEVQSQVNGFVKLTELGYKVCAKLREHKGRGGMFANFEYE